MCHIFLYIKCIFSPKNNQWELGSTLYLKYANLGAKSSSLWGSLQIQKSGTEEMMTLLTAIATSTPTAPLPSNFQSLVRWHDHVYWCTALAAGTKTPGSRLKNRFSSLAATTQWHSGDDLFFLHAAFQKQGVHYIVEYVIGKKIWQILDHVIFFFGCGPKQYWKFLAAA